MIPTGRPQISPWGGVRTLGGGSVYTLTHLAVVCVGSLLPHFVLGTSDADGEAAEADGEPRASVESEPLRPSPAPLLSAFSLSAEADSF